MFKTTLHGDNTTVFVNPTHISRVFEEQLDDATTYTIIEFDTCDPPTPAGASGFVGRIVVNEPRSDIAIQMTIKHPTRIVTIADVAGPDFVTSTAKILCFAPPSDGGTGFVRMAGTGLIVRINKLGDLWNYDMTDLKLIDELLCDLQQTTGKSWPQLEQHSSTTRAALARLQAAVESGEMTVFTAAIANYFETRQAGEHPYNWGGTRR